MPSNCNINLFSCPPAIHHDYWPEKQKIFLLAAGWLGRSLAGSQSLDGSNPNYGSLRVLSLHWWWMVNGVTRKNKMLHRFQCEKLAFVVMPPCLPILLSLAGIVPSKDQCRRVALQNNNQQRQPATNGVRKRNTRNRNRKGEEFHFNLAGERDKPPRYFPSTHSCMWPMSVVWQIISTTISWGWHACLGIAQLRINKSNPCETRRKAQQIKSK